MNKKQFNAYMKRYQKWCAEYVTVTKETPDASGVFLTPFYGKKYVSLNYLKRVSPELVPFIEKTLNVRRPQIVENDGYHIIYDKVVALDELLAI